MARQTLFVTAGFLVALSAFCSYYLYFSLYPATRDVPWANLLLFAASALLLVLGWRPAPAPGIGRKIAVALSAASLLLLSAFLAQVYWLSYRLPSSAAAPEVGAPAPDFTLRDTSGTPRTLSRLLASPIGALAPSGAGRSAALLVFYRGYW